MSKGFRRNFLDLTTGTLIAQILSFAVMPIVSRLYLPAEMGEYALYVSISSIVGLVSNLRMDLAVVIGRSDKESEDLAWVGLLSSFCVAILSYFVLIAWRDSNPFTVMTALTIFGIGGVQTVAQWHSRNQNYKIMAQRNIFEKLIVLSLSVTCGLWAYTQWGLIAAQTAGTLFALLFFFLSSDLPFPPHISLKLLKSAKAFSDFPTMNLISSLALVMAFFVPALLFASYFSKDQLGHYSLVIRLFEVPINLVAYTFNTVYYQHAAKVERADRKALFSKSLLWLAASFAPPFIFVAIFAYPLITFLFGDNWGSAAAYAVWLAPYTFFRMLYLSQAALLLVERRLRNDMTLSIALFVSQIGGFYLGLVTGGGPIHCVASMSLLGSCVYLLGLWTVRRSVK